MVSIEIKAEEAIRELAEMEARISNPGPLLDDIGRYMVSSTQRKINQGIPPANAPLTRKVKEDKDGKQILKDKGRLINSFTHRVGPDYVAIGTSVKYARIHQFGGTITPKRAVKLAIPATRETRRLMRRHGASVRAAIQSLKASGWRIWFREKSIMGVKGRGKPEVLFIRKDAVKIPARPFLKLDEIDEREIRKKLQEYILGD